MPRKGQFVIKDRYCLDCHKKLWKYSKPINQWGIDLCYFCEKERRKIKWKCIDCNKPVLRKRKRCRECNKKNLSIRGKYVRTEKHREIMRQRMIGRDLYWLRGKKRPEHSKYLKKWWADRPEERQKAKERMLLLTQDKNYLKKLSDLLSGEKNPNWKNGLSKKPYKHFYQKLKDKIRKRDNYTCQLCNKTEKELGYRLSVNHIDFNKENSNENNLNCLCKRCNSLINFEREKWTKYFQEKNCQQPVK